MQIGKYIKQFLKSHNRVSISGFGTFSVKYLSADVNTITHKAHPPRREIDFSSQVAQGEELLVDYISKEKDISIEQVKIELEKMVASWKETLDSEKTLEFLGLGTIVKDDTSRLSFLTSKDFESLPSAFGLESFEYENSKNLERKKAVPKSLESSEKKQPLAFEKQKQRKDSEKALESDLDSEVEAYLQENLEGYTPFYEEQKSKNMKNNILIGVVLILTVLIMGYLIFDPFSSSDMDSMLPVSVQPPDKEDPMKRLATEDSLDAITDRYEDVEPKNPVQTPMEKELHYHVIGGSFRFDSNAHKFARQLKSLGYSDARYVGETEDGYHRVSYGSFATRVEAERFLSEVKGTVDNKSWILTTK